MKKVITYGTFDLLHTGHINLLRRAKQLGDYLIVGVTSENYDNNRGKLNIHDTLLERISNVKKTGFADEIIVEEYEGQKINDILKYKVDIFTIGSDWKGKFDYIKEYCDVIYLSRTKGISSTQLRGSINTTIKMGIVGYGRIADRFIPESKYVSGINVEGVYGRNSTKAKNFCEKHQLKFFSTSYAELLSKVDVVYIATPHKSHYEYIKEALLNSKNVLCEKPMVLSKNEAIELYNLAKRKKLVLMEAIKTAYCPGFGRLVVLAKSGVIGNIKSVEATFTKLISEDTREFDSKQAGGSVTELATYPVMAILKLLGENIKDVKFYSYFDENKKVDLFTKIELLYNNSIASAKIGIGVKSEGEIIISGTKGYIYVSAPWWKTEKFEVKFEDFNKNKKYFYKFEQDGLRYELAEFILLINKKELESYKLMQNESIKIIEIIENFILRKNVIKF